MEDFGYDDKYIISQYEEYPYGARVYKYKDEYVAVLFFEDKINNMKMFNSEQQAEDCAEDWVLCK